jgi:DNA-binding NtrC family response regulator
MLTKESAVESGVEAIKAGAFDYLLKPVESNRLRSTTHSALSLSRERRNRRQIETILDRVAKSSAFPEILTCSPAMKPVFRLMERVLETDLTVLIQGESGTGKELVAQAIHTRGKRRRGPFVVLNCAALPENLVESELFGHEKGAFTGATAARTGHIELADKGTLFLDEIGELPLPTQPKFLRCLQDKRVQRVGGSQVKQVDFRLIAATNRDLMQQVLGSEFREDLFYRVAVFPILLPPLRDRPEDIPLLLKHFLAQAGRYRVWIEPQAAELLESYTWPGNVRELQNFTARLSVVMETDRLTAELAAEQLGLMSGQPLGELQNRPSAADRTGAPVSSPTPTVQKTQTPPARPGTRPSLALTPAAPGRPRTPRPEDVLPMEEVERRAIQQALAAFKGNVTETARALGIGRATLYRYIRKYELGQDQPEEQP